MSQVGVALFFPFLTNFYQIKMQNFWRKKMEKEGSKDYKNRKNKDWRFINISMTTVKIPPE